jgi:myosin heavy subunit
MPSTNTEETTPDIFSMQIEGMDFYVNLSEADFNDADKTTIVRAIREGWSLNSTQGKRRYYTGRAVEDVACMVNTKRKLYINHKNGEREVQEWAATWEESWVDVEEGKKVAKGKISFTANPFTFWLYGEAKKHPNEVGLSISGKGSFRSGTVEGKDAAIIESLETLNSVDFVTQAAAGGGVVKTMESIMENVEKNKILTEAIKSISDRIANYKKNEEPYIAYSRAMNAFNSFLSDLCTSSEVEDCSKEISSAMDELESELKVCMPMMRPKENPEDESKKESNETKEIKMTLEELKKDNPDIASALITEGKTEAEKEYTDKLKPVQDEVETLKAKVTESEKKEKELQDKLDVYEKEKKDAEKKAFIETKLKEAKIEDKVTEEFKTLLFGFEEAVIEKLVTDKSETIISTEGRVKGMGTTSPAPEPKKEINFKEAVFGKK